MIFAHVAEKFASRKAEWALAAMTTGYGVLYVIRPTLFADSPTDWFRSMREMMPQHYWALLCLSIGITRIAFLIINGAYHASPSIRCLAACANVGVWVALIVATYLNERSAQSLVTFPALLLLELLIIYETAVEWADVSRTKGQGARTYAASG